jgi:formiminotetrahydrofolate cyclodeaminase
MFVCTLCVQFLTLSSINAEKLTDAAITDVTAGTAATHRVLAHPLKDPPT